MAGTALRVALLGNQDSVHVQRWIDGLRGRGHDVAGIDLSGRHRTHGARIGAYLRLRRDLVEATRAGALVALHYVPDGVLASGLRGIHPLVASVWGGDVSRRSATGVERLARTQQRALLAHADARTATSRYLGSVLEDAYGLSATIVPFGVDTARFSPVDGGGSGVFRLAYVKWLEHTYGPDVLVEALALVSPILRIHVTLVGSGSMSGALERRIHALNLAGRVRVAGRVPHDQVLGVLAASDAFVMPSRMETFGVSALEASAMALPVIATRVGGIPEVVEDGVTGLLVEPEDPAALARAIERLGADADLRREMGAAGRAMVQARFEWNDCVVGMETVYREVMSRRRR